MILTTDDFTACFLDYFRKWIEPVRKEIPDFKLIAFIVFDYHRRQGPLEEWTDYIIKNKDWLYIASHGYYHEEPEAFNFNLMKKCRDFLIELKKHGASIVDAYKPPFYKFNYLSVETASKLGYRWFFMPDGILSLKDFRFYPRNAIGLVDSHANPESNLFANGKTIPAPDRLEFSPFKFLKNMCDFKWLI